MTQVIRSKRETWTKKDYLDAHPLPAFGQWWEEMVNDLKTHWTKGWGLFPWFPTTVFSMWSSKPSVLHCQVRPPVSVTIENSHHRRSSLKNFYNLLKLQHRRNSSLHPSPPINASSADRLSIVSRLQRQGIYPSHWCVKLFRCTIM